jgi:predicted dehydrogenase
MKICMAGLGSIGTRHLKNIYALLTDLKAEFYIDALRGTDKPLDPEVVKYIHKQYYSYKEIPDDYDIIFITNPTNAHYETLRSVVLKTKHIFIEKPVFDSIDADMRRLGLKEDGVYYVACPLRYTRVIQHLKELTEKEPVYSARCICSTYLPDWRPNTDYRQCYSAQAAMGGGVRIDLIHEWDYLQYLFGFPSAVAEYHGTFSHLEITSDDTAVYIAEYADKLVSLHLDYYGRINRREIELYVKDDVIVGDLIQQHVRLLKSGEIIDLHQERDTMQKAELEYFLGIINGTYKNTNDINRAFKTLGLTLGKIL